MTFLDLYRATPRLRERVLEVLSGTEAFFADIGVALARTSPTGEVAWHIQTFAILGLGVAVGLLVARQFGKWAERQSLSLFVDAPEARAEKIGFLAWRGVLMAFGAIIFAVVGYGLAMAVNGDISASRLTYLSFFTAFATIGIVRAVFLNFFAPDVPAQRMLALPDETAIAAHRGFTGAAAFACIVAAFCYWMAALGLSHDAHALMLVGGSLASALVFSFLFVAHRQPIAALITGSNADAAPKPLRLLAGSWHGLAVAYFLFTWFIASARILLDLPLAFGLVIGPMVIIVLTVSAYGVTLFLIDGAAARLAARRDPGEPETAEDPDDAAFDDGVGEETLPRPEPFKRLAERAAAFVAWLAGIGLVLSIWGVDVWNPDNLLFRAADILIVAFIAYLLYETVKIAIDQKIEDEGGLVVAAPGDEGGAAGEGSRLVTLLPLFRNFLLITVVVMAGMIILSEMGVDIAPLFAGAGVIGLAVGFGSQTLIRDIFSGAFFLIDDAFRLAEYVDIGEVKGTVEKISLRSVQLRHHRGALHTIPFGEIHRMTNYSRDWAMMKLELRVTYDTDVEKVRKLIKKFGQELQDDPEIGPKFLQPLKSQGVTKMEDSAMILRVKFMTVPGEQFIIRKRVYHGIREIFEREGIEFAHREVTVRLKGEGEDEDEAEEAAPDLSEGQKRAVGGAALSAVSTDDPAPAKS